MICVQLLLFTIFFFFNDTATTEIYTLSLHDALPIFSLPYELDRAGGGRVRAAVSKRADVSVRDARSEEHTSELQSPCNLVCRLLLEKKKNIHVSVLVSCHLTYRIHSRPSAVWTSSTN